MTQIVYDIETYPNVFTLSACSIDRDDLTCWEISDRRDDRRSLWEWLRFLQQNQIEMIGFNNVHFDYPFIHAIIENPALCDASTLYKLCERIIAGTEHVIWENQRYIPQIDLFKLNHFDNKSRRTSLKALEFAMRSDSIEDLPYPPGTTLTSDQIDKLREYNGHDVTETRKFALLCSEHIEFRRKLTDPSASLRLTGDVMNFNDTKIGKQFLIQQIGESICYTKTNGKREPRQTHHACIDLDSVIFPYIRFEHPEFNRILEWFKQQNVADADGMFKDVTASIDGFEFVFGKGGIHGSVERRFIQSDEHHAIIDIDVTSLYPSIAIVNRMFPEHLGETFVREYSSMKKQRVSYAKGTPENAMLKLALNGVYGDSGNIFSPFYDLKYLLGTTINGQLMLCMLAERVIQVPRIQLIQINTDGITVCIERSMISTFEHLIKQWEEYTLLELEQAQYKRMWIRDVNNYIAEYEDGKCKLKGAYWYPEKQSDYNGWWHKDFSAMIIQKSVHMALIHGIDPADLVRCGHDPFDFMLRGKVDTGAKLFIGDEQQQRICRYFIARHGLPIYTVRPPVLGATVGAFCKARGVSWIDYDKHDPLVWNPAVHTKNRSVYKDRKTSVQDGWNVVQCNKSERFDWNNLNYDWYINEARKLMIE